MNAPLRLARRAAPSIALAIAFAVSICSNGAPELRHDWHWPLSRFDFAIELRNALSGWSPDGLGFPNVHLSGYLYALAVDTIGVVAGPLPTLAIWACCIGFLVAFAATLLAGSLSARTSIQVAAAAFALFNPWTYSEVVAGHLAMILAYGGSLLLALVFADSGASRSRRSWIAVLAALLVAAQLQFAIVTIIALSVLAVRERIVMPLVTLLIVTLPLWLGLYFEYSNLADTEFTLAWQMVQSVPLRSAALLTGYAPHYAQRLPRWYGAADAAFCALAAVGCLRARRDARLVGAIALGVVAIAFSTGSGSIFAGVYDWLVQSVRPLEIYRELYDVLAYAAVGMVMLIAAAGESAPALRGVAALAGALLIGGWFVVMPSSFWVNGGRLPALEVHAPANTRFALFPPFQPLTYRGAGSGIDPDTFERPGYVTSLNEYLPGYPEAKALGVYAASGDPSLLEALSTSVAIGRPGYRQMNGTGSASYYRVLRPAPVAGECKHFGSTEDITQIGSCNIFAGDATPSNGMQRAWFPRVQSDARKGWVDARLLFADVPAIAEPFGGAATMSAARLPVTPASWYLMYVKGSLWSGGQLLARDTKGYAWVHVPGDAGYVRCVGICVLAVVTSTAPPNAAESHVPVRAIPLAQFTPWLAVVRAPDAGGLRFNVRFDPYWIAIADGKILDHVRVDATVNGWLVPPSSRNASVLLIEWMAALQALFIGAGIIWCAGLTTLLLRQGRESRHR